MAVLEGFVELSVAAALAKIGEIDAALKKATVASVNVTAAGAGGATTAVKDLGTATQATFRQFQQLTQVGSTMSKFVTLPILGAAAASAKLAIDFETSITKLTTLAGVPAGQINSIRDSLLALAPAVGQTPKALSDGLYLIESSGIHGAAALSTLKAVAEGAALGLGDLSKVTNAVTTILNSYPGGVITAAQATNVLIAATREGKVSADEFAGQLGRVVLPASLVGINMGEVAGAVATLTRVTGSASQATTDFSGFLTLLIKPSVQAQKALAGVGLSSQALLDTIKQKGLLAALDLLKEKFGDNTVALGQLFRNKQGLIGFSGLTEDLTRTAGIFDQTAAAARGTGDEISGFSTVAQTSSFKIKQAIAEISAIGIKLGGAIGPPLAGAAKQVADFIGTLSNLPGPVLAIGGIAAGIAAIGGPILVAIGQFGKLKTAIAQLPEGSGIQQFGNAVVKSVGVATSAIAGFVSGVAIASDNVATKIGGIVGAVSSIGIGFATGGPLGAGIAAISVAAGAIVGIFTEDAKKAEALNKAASDLATTLFNDLDPALRATAGFKLDFSNIASDAQFAKLKTDFETNFKKAFNTKDINIVNAGGSGFSIKDLADAALKGTDALNALEVSIAKVSLPQLDPSFDADLKTIGVTADQVAIAAAKGGTALGDLFNTKINTAAPDELQAIYDATGRVGTATEGLSSIYGKAAGQSAIAAQAQADLNTQLTDAQLAAEHSATGVSFLGTVLGAIETSAKRAADGTDVLTAAVAATQAQLDAGSQAAADYFDLFGKVPPEGIGVLDTLGLSVGTLTTKYSDLTKAVTEAQNAILAELNIPLSQAQQQIKDAADQVTLVKDILDVKGKTTTKGSGKKKTSTTTGDVQDQTFSTDITSSITLTPEAAKARTDIINGIAAAQKTYVDSIASGNSTLDQADVKYQAYIKNLENTAAFLGISQGKAEAFVQALHATPDEVKTVVSAFGLDSAVAGTDAYKQLLADLPPDVATQLTTDNLSAQQKVQLFLDTLNSLPPEQRAKVVADVQNLDKAQALKTTIDGTNGKSVAVSVAVTGSAELSAAKALLDSFKSKTVTATVRTVTTSNDGSAGGTRGNAPANGGFVGQFANGGVYAAATARVPQIATTRGPARGILWAEPETGWEAYISGKPSMRQRNIGILGETARRFGMTIVPRGGTAYAQQAGMLNMPAGPSSAGGTDQGIVSELRQMARNMDMGPFVDRLERLEGALMTMPPMTIVPAAGDPINAANKMWHHMARRRAEAQR